LCRDVDAGVERAHAGKRVGPFAEMAHQTAFHRPDARKHVRLKQGIRAAAESGNVSGTKEVVLFERFLDGRNETSFAGDVLWAFQTARYSVSDGYFAGQHLQARQLNAGLAGFPFQPL